MSRENWFSPALILDAKLRGKSLFEPHSWWMCEAARVMPGELIVFFPAPGLGQGVEAAGESCGNARRRVGLQQGLGAALAPAGGGGPRPR